MTDRPGLGLGAIRELLVLPSSANLERLSEMWLALDAPADIPLRDHLVSGLRRWPKLDTSVLPEALRLVLRAPELDRARDALLACHLDDIHAIDDALAALLTLHDDRVEAQAAELLDVLELLDDELACHRKIYHRWWKILRDRAIAWSQETRGQFELPALARYLQRYALHPVTAQEAMADTIYSWLMDALRCDLHNQATWAALLEDCCASGSYHDATPSDLAYQLADHGPADLTYLGATLYLFEATLFVLTDLHLGYPDRAPAMVARAHELGVRDDEVTRLAELFEASGWGRRGAEVVVSLEQGRAVVG